MILSEMADEMRRLSRQLDNGLDVLRDQANELAEAEHDYRKAIGVAWVEAPEGTVSATEAWVNDRTAGKRRRRDLAEHLSRAALESVRSRRTQISALQSLMNAHRAEAEMASFGPSETP